MPLFYRAVERVVGRIGEEAYVLATLRGPLLAASQLRGVEPLLMDLLEHPKQTAEVLDFTMDTAIRLGRWLVSSGADGLAIGEATCSPNFISPDLYRQFVHPRHRRLVGALKDAGWRTVGLHICGDTRAIIDDVISTGVDFMDVDYQVPANEAVRLNAGRIVLRGNLDPSAMLRFGSVDQVGSSVRRLCALVHGEPWIVSSGCDVPPGTPEENIRALVAHTVCEVIPNGK